MEIRHRSSSMLSLLSLLTLLVVLLSACGSNTGSTSGSTPPQPAARSVSIGLGYIPDIQFAPFYVAQSKSYYKAAGLNVTFHHGIVPDLIGSMVAGKNDFVFAGGDEVLEALDKNKSHQVIDVSTVFKK